jgi:hypothetical protein
VCFVLTDEKSFIALYEIYFDPLLLRHFIEPRITAYNDIAIARNNDLAEQVRAIMKSMEQAH